MRCKNMNNFKLYSYDIQIMNFRIFFTNLEFITLCIVVINFYCNTDVIVIQTENKRKKNHLSYNVINVTYLHVAPQPLVSYIISHLPLANLKIFFFLKKKSKHQCCYRSVCIDIILQRASAMVAVHFKGLEDQDSDRSRQRICKYHYYIISLSISTLLLFISVFRLNEQH
jgi:hypothetical protein